MAKERRDNKNRLLGKGEYQKPDGRYMYRYVDAKGNAQFLYSWTLTKTDRTPKGKTPGPCLRDLEKEAAINVQNEIDVSAAKGVTLDDYFEKYMSQKRRLKPTTRRNYRYKYDYFVRNTIGHKKLSDIKYSDIKRFYNGLLYDDGRKITEIMNIDVFLNPVFKLAVKDDCISRNPAEGVMLELKKEVGNNPKKKRALTLTQQKNLLEFVKNHGRYKKWYPMLVFMLGTGCRIGEVCGLTWDDCDFSKGVIKISRTLSSYPDEYTGKYRIFIMAPKTAAGIREIPMLEDVRRVLLQERARQMRDGFSEGIVDGVSRFVFITNRMGPYMPQNINVSLNRIVLAYNDKDFERASADGREPNPIPQISPHILRHTFCTRLCENDVNIKVIQEIMGHSSIRVTMDIYSDVTDEFRSEAFDKLGKKFSVG